MERFKNLVSWQISKVLCVEIYKTFDTCTDFSFKIHIEKTAVLIMTNIAESIAQTTNKKYVQYLNKSKGFCNEVLSLLIIALDLKKITNAEYNNLVELANELNIILKQMIKWGRSNVII